MPQKTKVFRFRPLFAVLGATLVLAWLGIGFWLPSLVEGKRSLGVYSLEIRRAKVSPAFHFSADTLLFTGSRVHAAAAGVSAGVDLWESLLALKPALSMTVASMRVDWEERETDPKDPKEIIDKISFPLVRIPFPFSVRIRSLKVASGSEARQWIDELLISSRQPTRIRFEAAGVSDSRVEKMTPSVRVELDWSALNRIYYAGDARHDRATLNISGSRRRQDLLQSRDTVRISLPTLSPFTVFFNDSAEAGNLPEVRDFRAEAIMVQGEVDSLIADFQARITPSISSLGEHRVSARIRADSVFRINLEGKGVTRGAFRLSGFLQRFQWNDWPDSLDLQGELTGSVSDYEFDIAGFILPGDAEFRRLSLRSGGVLDFDVKTGAGSELQGTAYTKMGWQTDFHGTVSPSEPWALAWTNDTNVTFQSGGVQGRYADKKVKVSAWLRQPTAYGSYADSAYAEQTIDAKSYRLDLGRVFGKGVVWQGNGEVRWGLHSTGWDGRGMRPVSLEFSAQSPGLGKLSFAMPSLTRYQFDAEALHVEKVPFRFLRKWDSYQPRLSGTVDIDVEEEKAEADVQGFARHSGMEWDGTFKGRWNEAVLNIDKISVGFAYSRAEGEGSLGLPRAALLNWKQVRPEDIRYASVSFQSLDMRAFLGAFLPESPLLSGRIDGRMDYTAAENTDAHGQFSGDYRFQQFHLVGLEEWFIPMQVTLKGRGDTLSLSTQLHSRRYEILNDTVELSVIGPLSEHQQIKLKADGNGLHLQFDGTSDAWRNVSGLATLSGNLPLPENSGEIRDLLLTARISSPLWGSAPWLRAQGDGDVYGRYLVAPLDTQMVSAKLRLHDSRLKLEDAIVRNQVGNSLRGAAEYRLVDRLLTANLEGDGLNLKLAGVEELRLAEIRATLHMQDEYLRAEAQASRVRLRGGQGGVRFRSELGEASVSYERPRNGSVPVLSPVPTLQLKARLENSLFTHRFDIQEIQSFFVKRKKQDGRQKVKPMHLSVDLDAIGSGNRIESDVIRLQFTGGVRVRGTYPYSLVTGEVSALKGELGQRNQAYDIRNFAVNWRNSRVEDGEISVDGDKTLAADCRPRASDSCRVFVSLHGTLQKIDFGYDSDCGAGLGEAVTIPDMLNSVRRGCFVSTEGGGYGETVLSLLEPTLNRNLSRVVEKMSGNWIQTVQVTGLGAMMGGEKGEVADTSGLSEALSLELESREFMRMSVRAKSGYRSDDPSNRPWEHRLAIQWRPPVAEWSNDPKWQARVKDRFRVEAAVETMPKNLRRDQDGERVNRQVGLRYRYKFWELW